MHVLHSNKTLDTLLTGTGMTSASACPIVYIYQKEFVYSHLRLWPEDYGVDLVHKIQFFFIVMNQSR